jgi:hypothetical protein
VLSFDFLLLVFRKVVYLQQPMQSPGISNANVAIFPQVKHGHQQVRQQPPKSAQHPWSGVVKSCTHQTRGKRQQNERKSEKTMGKKWPKIAPASSRSTCTR